MQSINTDNIQSQIATTIHKKPSEQNQKPVKTDAKVQNANAINLPEEIVDLSAISISQSSKSKKPSTPVSNSEKSALLKKFSDANKFSKYV